MVAEADEDDPNSDGHLRPPSQLSSAIRAEERGIERETRRTHVSLVIGTGEGRRLTPILDDEPKRHHPLIMVHVSRHQHQLMHDRSCSNEHIRNANGGPGSQKRSRYLPAESGTLRIEMNDCATTDPRKKLVGVRHWHSFPASIRKECPYQ